MYSLLQHKPKKAPWNKGKLVGQKPPLKLKEIWAIRIRLQIEMLILAPAKAGLLIETSTPQMKASAIARIRCVLNQLDSIAMP